MNSQVSITVMTQEEETVREQRAASQLIWKLDQRLIPFLALLEINRFGFQVGIGFIFIFFRMSQKIHGAIIGHAQLTTFKEDLRLTTEQNNWATSAFFLGYVSLLLLFTSSIQKQSSFTFEQFEQQCVAFETVGMCTVLPLCHINNMLKTL